VLVHSEEGLALNNWWIQLRRGVEGTEWVERFGCIGHDETIAVLMWLLLGQGFGGDAVSGMVGEDPLHV